MKNEYFYEKNIDENNYSIQEEGWLGILFLVGTIFFSGLLLYGFIDGQADFSVIVAYGILIAFSGICTLHLFLWRVKVNHDVIEYRSFFGKKYYKFSDITRSVHKENGTLEIYAGDKIIVKDGWLYRNGFLRKNCKIRLTDITQMKRKKNLFGEALILYKNQKKIAKISARNRNVDWLQVKIAEIKKDKKKLERKK